MWLRANHHDIDLWVFYHWLAGLVWICMCVCVFRMFSFLALFNRLSHLRTYYIDLTFTFISSERFVCHFQLSSMFRTLRCVCFSWHIYALFFIRCLIPTFYFKKKNGEKTCKNFYWNNKYISGILLTSPFCLSNIQLIIS